ncbi:hypothetical protein DsansV1_C25g0188031 [Dioscorea sansibarensis]
MPGLVNVFMEEMMKLGKKEKKTDTSCQVEEEKEKMNWFMTENEAGIKGEVKKEKREGISETTLVLILDRFAPC